MLLTALMSHAFAADLSPWVGEWGLDPAASDDPYEKLQQAIGVPLLSGGAARGLAPDGGADDREEQQRRLVSITTRLLALSGRIGLAPTEAADLSITYGGEPSLDVTLGRKWHKVKREDNVIRLRASAQDNLVVERRVKSAVLTETFLAPVEPGVLYAVVRVDGSGVDGLEFRRVYRALHE